MKEEELELDILAEKAYKAFYNSCDTREDEECYFGREPLKDWKNLSEKTRKAWVSVVREIISSCPV